MAGSIIHVVKRCNSYKFCSLFCSCRL